MERSRFTRRLAIVAAVTTLLPAPALADPGDRPGHGGDHGLRVSGQAVVEWNARAAEAALACGLAPTDDPLHESRMYAMMHLAIHDSLNAISRRAQPYAYRAAAKGAAPLAAIAAAARVTLVAAVGELPAPFSACAATQIPAIDRDYAAALAGVPEGEAKRRGVAVGNAAARTVLALRTGDGSDTPLFDTAYPQGDEPGEYGFTSATFPFAFAPGWGDVTPFALRSAAQFRSDEPYPVTSRRYARDFDEVKALGGDGVTTPSARTADQTEVARFWFESSPLLWNRLARSLSEQRRLDAWQAARLFGLLDLALADGYIGTFDQKYDQNFWRPVTAIRAAAIDGNPSTSPDPTWTPLLTTPPIPDHDSGHAVEGGAAAVVLREVFGSDRVSFELCSFTVLPGRTCTDASPVLRSFDSFSQAAAENAESRVLVGIHFRHATTSGTTHGRRIGRYVVRNFLEPAHRSDLP